MIAIISITPSWELEWNVPVRYYKQVDYFAISSTQEISCEKNTAFVVLLAKLHNFCIDETDLDITKKIFFSMVLEHFL